MDLILGSPEFRHSARGKQFLEFVVRNKLEGHDEMLKERTIGKELFRRNADYSTGDDPIVRVQAGELRKRLEHYYQAAGNTSAVRIELPVGSYVPEFHFHAADSKTEKKPLATEMKPRRGRWLLATVALVLLAGVLTVAGRLTILRPTALDRFWAPVFSTQDPVLICVSKPLLYRPSIDLFRRYVKTHPGTFDDEVDRLNEPLPLDPKDKISWGEMITFPDFGVGAGDVYAAFRISGVLGKLNKPTQLRIGNGPAFEDLRNSPAVIVGAFSNRWTMELTSGLRYGFAEKDGIFWIQDRTDDAKRWYAKLGQHWQVTEDYGVATRLLDSKTGHLVITVGGITAAGSDAASEFVSNPDYLAAAFRSAPTNWDYKNLQVVVRTAVVDSIAGPPQVVAINYW